MQWFNFNLQDFSVSFLSILFEGAPFMFIGTLIAGFVDAFVPPQMMERILPRNTGIAIGLSALLGIAFPMCECGLVPVIRRMIGKGMPISCALTYLLSAPIVNPIVAVSTIAAFRGQRPILTASLRLGNWFCRGMHRGTDRSTRVVKTRSKPGNASFLAESEASLNSWIA
jgi:uncharacterized membrane protein YraQ (UPF0718 family)